MRNRLPQLELPDQSGRTWLITGATHGVGKETARAAVTAGANVIITARNAALGEQVRRELGADRVLPLDLASLASVRAAAAELDRDVDVLINNAGCVPTGRKETADGFELAFGTNFLGPFAFTNAILDRVRERIVIVASLAHRQGEIDLADPHFRHRRFTPNAAYAQSKLADMLWGLELERRVRASGRPVHLVHPGWVVSNLQNVSSSARVNAGITAVSGLVGQSASDGAQPSLYAATRDLPSGSYVGVEGNLGFRGRPSLRGRSAVASDPMLARQVWELAVSETGADAAR